MDTSVSNLPLPAWLSGLNLGSMSGASPEAMGGDPGAIAPTGAQGPAGGLGLGELSQLLAQQSDAGGSILPGATQSLFAPIGGTIGQGIGSYSPAQQYYTAGATGTPQPSTRGYMAGQTQGGTIDPLMLIKLALKAANPFAQLLGQQAQASPGTQSDIAGTTPAQQEGYAQYRAGERQDLTSPFSQYASQLGVNVPAIAAATGLNPKQIEALTGVFGAPGDVSGMTPEQFQALLSDPAVMQSLGISPGAAGASTGTGGYAPTQDLLGGGLLGAQGLANIAGGAQQGLGGLGELLGGAGEALSGLGKLFPQGAADLSGALGMGGGGLGGVTGGLGELGSIFNLIQAIRSGNIGGAASGLGGVYSGAVPLLNQFAGTNLPTLSNLAGSLLDQSGLSGALGLGGGAGSLGATAGMEAAGAGTMAGGAAGELGSEAAADIGGAGLGALGAVYGPILSAMFSNFFGGSSNFLGLGASNPIPRIIQNIKNAERNLGTVLPQEQLGAANPRSLSGMSIPDLERLYGEAAQGYTGSGQLASAFAESGRPQGFGIKFPDVTKQLGQSRKLEAVDAFNMAATLDALARQGVNVEGGLDPALANYATGLPFGELLHANIGTTGVPMLDIGQLNPTMGIGLGKNTLPATAPWDPYYQGQVGQYVQPTITDPWGPDVQPPGVGQFVPQTPEAWLGSAGYSPEIVNQLQSLVSGEKPGQYVSSIEQIGNLLNPTGAMSLPGGFQYPFTTPGAGTPFNQWANEAGLGMAPPAPPQMQGPQGGVQMQTGGGADMGAPGFGGLDEPTISLMRSLGLL